MAKIWLVQDFLAQEIAETPWLVKGLVTSVGISMLFAHPKTGKTILSSQLATALATGEPFLGVKPDRAYKVLYVQCDQPYAEWFHQLRSLNTAWDWRTTWLPESWLYNYREYHKLKQQIVDEEFEVVILDSLTAMTVGHADVNELNSARRVLTRVRELVGDVPTWLVHHKRKGAPGVPDNTSTSAAGNFGLGAGVSVLYDLSDNRLQARGRYLSIDMTLTRDKATGLWLAPAAKSKTTTKAGLYS